MYTKTEIIAKYLDFIEMRIKDAREAIELAKASRNSETKSSMGDKYETGREMVQQEIEKHEGDLARVLEQKHALMKIDVNSKSQIADIGSVVCTNYGVYFISMSLGKIEIDKIVCYAISLNSPLGQKLFGKKKGDEATINNRTFTITDIL